MIKAIIFDYGGVIKSSEYHCWVDGISNAYNISKEKAFQMTESIMGLFYKGFITENKFWEHFSSIVKKPIPENKEDIWRRCYEETFYIHPEIIKLVKKLKTKKIKTAILSNTIKPHVEIIKKHNGFKGFDVVVLSCEVGLMKPDPAIYLLTVKKLKVKPEGCIFIDDGEENLRPARELGMKTILAKDPKQVINDISRILQI